MFYIPYENLFSLSGKYTTRKIDTKLHPGLEGCIFHILTSEDIDDFTAIKLSLKLFFNSLVYDQNIFGSSSKVFGNLRKSLGIFRDLRKFLQSVLQHSYDLRTSFWEFFEIFGKWSEILEKSSKTLSSGCLYNKKITC